MSDLVEKPLHFYEVKALSGLFQRVVVATSHEAAEEYAVGVLGRHRSWGVNDFEVTELVLTVEQHAAAVRLMELRTIAAERVTESVGDAADRAAAAFE